MSGPSTTLVRLAPSHVPEAMLISTSPSVFEAAMVAHTSAVVSQFEPSVYTRMSVMPERSRRRETLVPSASLHPKAKPLRFRGTVTASGG